MFLLYCLVKFTMVCSLKMFNRIKIGHKGKKSAFSRILIYIYYSFSHVGYRKQGYFCPCALNGRSRLLTGVHKKRSRTPLYGSKGYMLTVLLPEDEKLCMEEILMETVFAWLIILGGLYGFVLLICNLIVDGIKFKDFIKSRRKNHHD